MKKLLITSMAAVAVSICAKAAFTGNESFENYNGVEDYEGPLFDVNNETGKYIYGLDWMTEATPEDGIFTVTNITDITTDGDSYPKNRPLDGDNANALAIDTEKSLIRRVIQGVSSDSDDLEGASLEGGPIFFDSVVQFTATEAAPTPDSANGDKLMVWLYVSDGVDNDNPGVFGETKPTTNLVITAGYGADQIATNYLTNLQVAPETWHRLTITALNDIDTSANFVPGFEVRLDGELVSGVLDYQNDEAESVTTFPSLMKSHSSGVNQIIGVAFEGKGAVDDLVFTTTDPFAGGGGEEPEPEPGKFTLKFTIDADAEADAAVLNVVADETEIEDANDGEEDGSFTLGVDVKSVVAKIVCGSGYKVTEATASTEEGVWILQVDVTSAVAGGEITCNVVVVEDSGSGDEPGTETPTVDPTSGTLSAVVAGDAEADPGAIADQVTISISAADAAAGVTATYFKKTADYDQAKGQWVVTVALDETVVQPSADEALEKVAAALTGDGTTVSITYTGDAIKPGLYYGLAAAGDLTALETAVPASFARATTDGVALSADKPEGNAGFFKVVISATNPNPVQE